MLHTNTRHYHYQSSSVLPGFTSLAGHVTLIAGHITFSLYHCYCLRLSFSILVNIFIFSLRHCFSLLNIAIIRSGFIIDIIFHYFHFSMPLHFRYFDRRFHYFRLLSLFFAVAFIIFSLFSLSLYAAISDAFAYWFWWLFSFRFDYSFLFTASSLLSSHWY